MTSHVHRVAAVATGRRSLRLEWGAALDPADAELCVISPDGDPGPWAPAPPDRIVRGLAYGQVYGFRLRRRGGESGPVGYGSPRPPDPALPESDGEVPLVDADRQSLVLRLAGRDVLLSVWWQPQSAEWFGSLEVPAGWPAVGARRIAVGSGLLDGLPRLLDGGNIVCRSEGGGGEPGRDAWTEPATHRLHWIA